MQTALSNYEWKVSSANSATALATYEMEDRTDPDSTNFYGYMSPKMQSVYKQNVIRNMAYHFVKDRACATWDDGETAAVTWANTYTKLYINSYTNTSTCTATTAYWTDALKRSAPPLPSVSESLKKILEARQAPFIIVRRSRPLSIAADIREARARQTMRRVLGDEGYQRFLCRGFVSVRAKSGRVYQIFPGHEFTRVYENGRMIERLCVVFKGSQDFPATDSLIMRYLLVLNDEDRFWALANKHGPLVTLAGAPALVDSRPLTEIMADLRDRRGLKLVA